jgi:predicted metal-dependent enzyme (double-stranded beta helix superfamily)
MTAIASCPGVEALVQALDEATRHGDDEVVVREVKRALEEAIGQRRIELDARWLRPAPDRYARRLLHKDPAGRYSVLVMVWDKGQGTKLHDHGGNWCVEAVYQGEIEVTSYAVTGGDPEQGVVQFKEASVVRAGIGKAGALIPPFEYHVLRNPAETPAITMHVYAGELTSCHVFEPVEGGWRRQYVALSYTD